MRLQRLCSIEDEIKKLGFGTIAGVDEAGRGPLAGPVVAAACILPDGLVVRGINDSKKLTFEQRYKLYQDLIIHAEICYGVGVVEAFEIDQINILQATFKAMLIAIARLAKKPDYLLFDGTQLPQTQIPCQGIIDGDLLCQSIAAASIIAKVTRDHIMLGYHDLFPNYGFNEHKGYGTSDHLRAIEVYGPCDIHRKSFGLLKLKADDLILEEQTVS
ncbi:MAG: ribonuclease HII [Chlamydiae bacterium]|nr:ribonuclease HII [Chlamydiota bacterium]